MYEYDVIIAGGGPAGYSAALYCARASLRTLLIEELAAGGQMSLAPYIENYPGFDAGVEGLELASKMQKGAEKAGALTLYASVLNLDLRGKNKKISTSKGDFTSKTVILAMGASPRTPGLPGESRLLGRGLSYCAACDGPLFKNKTAAVMGGGNSALGEALTLSYICRKVFLIHRGGSFSAEKISVNAVNDRANIIVLQHTEVTGFIIENDYLAGLELKDKTSGGRSRLDCDGLFVAIGRVPNTKLCRPYVLTDQEGYIIADESTCTNIPGVFAAGDLRRKPLRQIITAAADGAVAAMKCEKYISEAFI